MSRAQTELRGYEIRINLERGPIMRERPLEVPCHAQQFAVGILRIRLFGQHGNVAIHGRECLVKLAIAGLDVSQIVQRGREILVNGQRLLKEALRLVVAVLSHQPVAREIEQMLVVGIHLQHVVHGRNAAQEVAFLHLGDPCNHQLLAGHQLGRDGLGLGASRADFVRIAAVKGDPRPRDREIGVFLHRRAPLFVAPLEIEVLVILHALFIELASLGGTGCNWQVRGLALLDMVGINRDRRGQTQTEG